MHELEKREAKMREDRERGHLDDFRRRSADPNHSQNLDFDDDDTDRDYNMEFENDVAANNNDDDGDQAAYDDLDGDKDDDDEDDAVVNENIYKDADDDSDIKDDGWSRIRGNETQQQQGEGELEQTKHYQMTLGKGEDARLNLESSHNSSAANNTNIHDLIRNEKEDEDGDDEVLDDVGQVDNNNEDEDEAFRPREQPQQEQPDLANEGEGDSAVEQQLEVENKNEDDAFDEERDARQQDNPDI